VGGCRKVPGTYVDGFILNLKNWRGEYFKPTSRDIDQIGARTVTIFKENAVRMKTAFHSLLKEESSISIQVLTGRSCRLIVVLGVASVRMQWMSCSWILIWRLPTMPTLLPGKYCSVSR
jgi:hypothetical protein